MYRNRIYVGRTPHSGILMFSLHKNSPYAGPQRNCNTRPMNPDVEVRLYSLLQEFQRDLVLFAINAQKFNPGAISTRSDP